MITDIRTVKVAELKLKLGFNLHDPIIPKQESIGLILKKVFTGMEMTEDFYIKKLESMFNFYFKKYGRVVEIDELGHADRDPVKEKTRQKN